MNENDDGDVLVEVLAQRVRRDVVVDEEVPLLFAARIYTHAPTDRPTDRSTDPTESDRNR
jgi:hypothetical protein